MNEECDFTIIGINTYGHTHTHEVGEKPSTTIVLKELILQLRN